MRKTKDIMSGQGAIKRFSREFDITYQHAFRMKHDDRLVVIGDSVYKKILEKPKDADKK